MADNCLQTDVNAGKTVRKRRTKKRIPTIEGGTSGDNVWIGATDKYYHESGSFDGQILHVLMLSVDDAKSVIEMLQANIDHVSNKSA
jgi:hypothetical protein